MLRTLRHYSYDFTFLSYCFFAYCVALIIANILIVGHLKKNKQDLRYNG